MPADPTAERLTHHLRAVSQRYPHAWDAVAGFRRERAALGGWPAWCYCPVSGAYAIVSGGGSLPPDRAGDIAVVAALAAWRATQGIYRLDPDLLAALLDTPVAGDLPDELLTKLPEWCLYVDLPGGDHPKGFWAHLERDANDGRTELRLLLDDGHDDTWALVPVVLHLGHGTLSAAIAAAMDETELQARRLGGWGPAVRSATEQGRVGLRPIVEPLVSVLLYLCSAAAEIRDSKGTGRRPSRPAPMPVRTGPPKDIPAANPTTWEVGWRIGAALRSAGQVHDDPSGAGHRHAAPRAHLRRAHWHAYWSGPRSVGRPGTRLAVRWLHPVLVAAGDPVPTIHQVD